MTNPAHPSRNQRPFHTLVQTTLLLCFLVTIFQTSLFSFENPAPRLLRSEDTLNPAARLYTLNDSTAYLYQNPGAFEFVPNIGRDLCRVPLELFEKENLIPLAGVVASTAILLYFDQDLIDASQRFGRFIGLGTDNNTYNLLPTNKVPFYVPTSLPAALYYIGDGLTEVSVNAGFYLYGGIKNDARARRTASELTEGLTTIGILVQTLKRSTGHETPMRASIPRGRWRPFPSFSEYQSSVPTYDAYPSGHLASAMVTTTVISMNYPEYKFIKPLCYSLMTLCGYQMMNNGVHWMSDYPLAIAMGYAVGRTAVTRGRTAIVSEKSRAALMTPRTEWFVLPSRTKEGLPVLELSLRF